MNFELEKYSNYYPWKIKIKDTQLREKFYEADLKIKSIIFPLLLKIEDILREKIKIVIKNKFADPEIFRNKYREKRVNFVRNKLLFLHKKGVKSLNYKKFFRNLTFGELIYYFQDLKAEYKEKIDEWTFRFLKVNVLISWLLNLKLLRNLLCHWENIINRKFEESIWSKFMNWYFKEKLKLDTYKNDTFWHYLAILETFNKALNLNENISNKIFEIFNKIKKTTRRSDHHVPEIYIPDTEGWRVFLNNLYSKYIKNQVDFITVWIIARNEEKAIWNTLKYLLQQIYPHNKFEIILIDWNSQDKTIQIAKQILSKWDVKYKILNEANFTSNYWFNFWPCFARNLVIKNASKKSKYIAWLDADCRPEKNWLENLYKCIKKFENNPQIVWAGGPRLVETNWASKKELVLNYYFTSCIISLWNPAFCSKGLEKCKEKICRMRSLAWYNSIYKKEILEKYMYDERLVITDDVEINYRIAKDWYKFVLCPNAKIYHREEEKFWNFVRNMMRYWINIWNAIRKHKSFIRPYVPISLGYFFYTILLPIWIWLSYKIFWIWYLPLLPYVLLLTIAFLVFIENFKKTKSFWSLRVIPLVFLHLFVYWLGIVLNLLKIKGYFRK